MHSQATRLDPELGRRLDLSVAHAHLAKRFESKLGSKIVGCCSPPCKKFNFLGFSGKQPDFPKT